MALPGGPADRETGSADETGTAEAVRIDLVGVGKRYDGAATGVTALADVTLRVGARGLLVILGPSGCGKTTLLNLIGTLDTPTTGTVRLDGVDVTRASRRTRREVRRRAVSFVFQSFNLFPALTARENVRFGADVAGRDRAGEVTDEVLAGVGLAERAAHFPHQLSGGEQQRVAIARAIATGNPILLADEPTGELDVTTGVRILELLRDQSAQGRTVLVVTHNREIARIADRVIELSGGRIVHDGPPPGGQVPVAELRW
ncbi:ABC-type antimicrobial peptide transport system, ATPase component [Frankia torreyi]|uniref:ABC-type antimicrobial peptide transport system, ATPase component n=1 Tax=Frankia torreyi TaxID=1856 RepID=A0A0D8B6K9_9ACTN|nr:MULTISPECIES: ABC transporter ATP-binding protein [Frankia]KJE19923.1 ABC-type antimicrobial peptide transport system, ATPase component [Frankia torreyi]KJE21470.1 ABC-type antimicrobial peptide transport system, ATPase component [Frankia torreyi]KQM07497.1 ABC-type antimicrobial peptide transport system, ATPase component [Frankia sp. CpI1-P]